MAFNQLSPKELQELEDSFKALKIEPDHGNIEELEQAIKEEFLEGEDPSKPVYLSVVELPASNILN